MRTLPIHKEMKEGKDPTDSPLVSLFLFGAVGGWSEEAEELALEVLDLLKKNDLEGVYDFLDERFELEELGIDDLTARYQDAYIELTGEIEPVDGLVLRPGTEVRLSGNVGDAMPKLADLFSDVSRKKMFYERYKGTLNQLINILIMTKYPELREADNQFIVEEGNILKIEDSPEDMRRAMKAMSQLQQGRAEA